MAERRSRNPEAVETLRRIAEDVLVDERTRGQNLDSKTASLAAFSGTILALDATLGQGLLRRDLSCLGDDLLPVFFLIAASALVVAASRAGWASFVRRDTSAWKSPSTRCARHP